MDKTVKTAFGVQERSSYGGSAAVIADRGTAMTHRGYKTVMTHLRYNERTHSSFKHALQSTIND